MAKIIKAKKRGGAKTRVITKVKRVTVGAKRAARRARRAVSINVSKKDILVTCAAGGAGAIGSAFLVSKMPESVPDMGKNAIIVAVGAFAAYKGFKKRNKALIGAGIGAASVGAAGLVASAKAAADANAAAATVSAPLSAPLSAIAFDEAAALNAPIDAELAGIGNKVMI
ncbi:MAG: hypothetical protein J6W40_03365 [Alphaproteobacteria bacterium]|nr:hypothetical protein [Alphaproteobacteria bacterium]